jgi:hypothetical protein
MESCPKCRAALPPGAEECPACGVILAKLKPTGEMPIPASRPAPPPPPQPTAGVAAGAPPAAPSVPTAGATDPYAPPRAPLERRPILPIPAPDPMVITRPTLDALESARPWIGFVAVFGLVINFLMLVAAAAMMIYGSDNPKVVPIALVYFVSAAVGFVVLFPLRGSASALGRVAKEGAASCLEAFAIQHATFWRRTGAICVAYLLIAGIAVLLGVLGAATR